MDGLVGSKGDIFWNLSPVISYAPGSELGLVVYVANPTSEEREYALMARLLQNTTVVSEESITVYDKAWFKVDPGDFIRLFGAVIFDFTNVTFVLELVEKESDEVTDTVATYLVSPSEPVWPPGWPGAPAALTAGFDWTALMAILMIGMIGTSMIAMSKEEEEEELPPGGSY